MKIINVVQDFNAGGIQKLLLEYLKYFKDNQNIDYQVVVLEKKYNSIYDKICEKEHLKIIYLNSHISENKHYYIRKLQDWKNYNFPLYRYLKKEKPDVVHTHNTRIFIRIQWCIKKLHNKYKWFHTLHSDPYAVNDIHVPIAKRVFNEYNVCPICLNETQFIKAKERYDLKTCEFLFNAFDQEALLKNVSPKETIKKELQIPQDCLVIGCVGRIAPVKNYSFFVEIMNEIIKQNPKAIGLIVGDKSNAKEVEDKIHLLNLEKHIRLVDTRNDIQNIFNILDRFVITSISEASSFVVLEAQLFGKYCVISSAIPKESICSNKVVSLGLEQSPKTWASEILHPVHFSKQIQTLENYSIINTTKKMLNIYSK